MAISLYDISIASYRQTVGATIAVLEKGRQHCASAGIDLDEIVQTRLHPDMLPFSFQVHSVVHHSLGAIEGVLSGKFGPPRDLPDLDYRGLQRKLGETLDRLESFTPEQVDGHEGGDVVFGIGERQIPFTAEGFVLSFSLPNLHFHAATAYDILRMKGVPLGKRDFMGQMQVKS